MKFKKLRLKRRWRLRNLKHFMLKIAIRNIWNRNEEISKLCLLKSEWKEQYKTLTILLTRFCSSIASENKFLQQDGITPWILQIIFLNFAYRITYRSDNIFWIWITIYKIHAAFRRQEKLIVGNNYKYKHALN